MEPAQGAILAEPEMASAYRLWAEVLADRGQRSAAIRAFERAIALDPQDVAAHHGRAKAIAPDLAYEEVVEAYLEALVLEPDRWPIFQELSCLAQDRGFPDESNDWFNLSVPLAWLRRLFKQDLFVCPIAGLTNDRSLFFLESAGVWYDGDRHLLAFTGPNPNGSGEVIIINACDGNVLPLLLRGPVDRPEPLVLPGSALSLVARWSENNYFHWCFDALARLAAIDQSGQDWSTVIDSIDHVLVTSTQHRYQQESLALLGLADRVVRLDQHPAIQAQELVIPAAGGRNLAACDFFRRHLLPAARQEVRQRHLSQGDQPTHLYISRRKSRRHLLNEAEVLALLEPRGFVPIVLEDLPLAEQIVLIAGARAIVAPHGAGLTNIVFCEPGTIVIELFNGSYCESSYQTIANLIGAIHQPLIFTPDPSSEAAVNPNAVADSFAVQIDRLHHLLDRLNLL